MNLSFGYYGAPAAGPTVSRNPLMATPPNHIVLTQDQVDRATMAMGLPPWEVLAPNQQKMVAGIILSNSPDPVQQAQGSQVLLSNPAYQVFTIILGAAAL